ncbi:MAG: ribose 5-phosphate isomerase A [Promethearchaeota archaeon]
MREDLIEKGKKTAAYKAVEENVEDNMIIGIGSGSTVVFAVERLARLVKEKKLNIKCVATSFQSYQLVINYGLILVSLDQYPVLDLDIDGADEIDKDLNLIKGGGGCLVQEKIIAYNSKKLIIIADFRKKSNYLGEHWKKGIPVEVIPLSYIPIMRKLEQLKGKPVLRMAQSKAGPLVTDNGNFIIDVDFGIMENPLEIHGKIMAIPGVVDTGLFINMASKAYIGLENGEVLTLIKK